MTIDERLDKLTERHEALTQTVEIIASMHRENEKLFAEMRRENEKRFAENEKRFEKLTDLFGGLLGIVKQHEIRLNNLDRPLS
jgi:DNA anti-recombination protein RmuC